MSALGPSTSAETCRIRRSKHFKRQSRVADERAVKKQQSEPTPRATVAPKVLPTLQKHQSYPQYAPAKSILIRKPRSQDPGSIQIQPVTSTDRQTSTTRSATTSSNSVEPAGSDSAQTRASHTPAVRSGPPLSCNFCWNTVDECGRILRRKTQYHCPECRTNLCIVPCFHEYHDGPENERNSGAR